MLIVAFLMSPTFGTRCSTRSFVVSTVGLGWGAHDEKHYQRLIENPFSDVYKDMYNYVLNDREKLVITEDIR